MAFILHEHNAYRDFCLEYDSMAEKTQRMIEAKTGEEPEARARQEARDK